MTSFTDTHHDTTRATLFDAWYELQTPRVRERLNDWMLVSAATFRKQGNFSADTALDMAQALVWALANRDMRQILAVLERREITKEVMG